MALLPSGDPAVTSSLTHSSTTAAAQKLNFTALRTFISDLLGVDSADKQAARTALGSAASGANADITSLAGPVSSANAAPLLHLNDIINGDVRIAQAGTSFAAAVNGAYDLDGWLNTNTSTAVFTVAQVAGSTAGSLARRVTVTTADAVVAIGDVLTDQTRIEGFNIEKYVGKTFTVSFKKAFPVAGIHCVALRNSGLDRSYVAEINVPVANVVQNCSFTVVGGLPTAGTWNYTNGVGLDIAITHMCGTTFQTTANAWNTGNFLGTANQVNDCATVGNVWAMEKVTMNLGTVAAVSEISVEAELIRCQRYYQQLGNAAYAGVASGFQVSTTTAVFTLPMLAPMRAAPAIGFSNLIVTDRAGFDAAVSGIAAAYTTSTAVTFSATNAAAGAAARPVLLSPSSAGTGFLSLSARL